MHLLASQPGGFVDDEGIIDLQQSPADIVILSAADSSLAALADALDVLGSSEKEIFPEVRLANWLQIVKPAAFDLYRHKVLDHAKVVVLSLLGGRSYWEYGFEQCQDWLRAATPDQPRHLIIVPGDDTPDPQLQAVCSTDNETSDRIWRYLREGGVLNSQSLLHYLADMFFQQTASAHAWREPAVLPRAMVYMPPELFSHRQEQERVKQASLQDWQQYWQKTDRFQKSQELPGAVVLLLFYRSHLQSGNTGVFDGLVQALLKQGLRPLPVAVASLKDAESLLLINSLIETTQAQLLINTTGFASNTVACPDLSSEPSGFDAAFVNDVPVLQLVLSSSTEEDWDSHQQGLRSRDIAMQVVLPEMDGRVITRAVSFKAENHFNERAQVSVVRYQLHDERANFIAKLARRYCALAGKSNQDKRIALILANYPTKDGRIGNGVGLDTPASTINILKAMETAGYPIEDMPENGNALIEELLGAITNNPNTLHQLPCWQSLALDDYQRCFETLPVANQQAIIERWGAPEQDPKCRQGRLMIAGIRLGETFVGIQPARGFNVDLAANYHDPDLVPPHSYLAFYFWLREIYAVEAVIHVGKHGNLEWLPGKGTALSSGCWPDAVLGPMPHFYPFIVNDPGEGAQAKRRTQAVIIDHLMPPMTRAETYGELAELESLVDEFYQAMGMDKRREDWLREKILQQLKSTHVLQEITGNTSVDEQPDDDSLLEELDAYLCDIKEAQIRHGLHRLGELPNIEKLADTLVALLRLPRGNADNSRGILQCLVEDFELTLEDGSAFEPLSASHKPWTGGQPSLLQSVSAESWRSEADTRERLELLARHWVIKFVLHEQAPWQELEAFPCSQALLYYAWEVLHPTLQKSAELEIHSLIRGLAGKFVAPGPSGAPTRGRLDTLPTGRNFFSVDNRSIPSPAAWAIGERSAQALIERHLQEEGDYPRELGLSVWGTATMRTGGDDIAQAFALMGIKPIWAPGSQRVVDFEIVPTMLLGRPRVDVTLRVSGFFRDAFPNVMKLYDAAVVALAQLDEPGDGNCIRRHIEQRQRQLEAQGLSAEEAFRQSSYRVFGSKPGAYGAGLQGLIDERCWEERSDLAEAYLNWGGYAYGKHQLNDKVIGQDESQDLADGVAAHGSFQYRLSQLEAVVQNQDNREHDLLDSDDYYQFQGGMSNAVTTFSGKMPAVYHADHANPSAPKIRTLKEELNRVVRSRVLNPKWIEAMREHGYKGAFEMSASIDYLFAYDATTDLVDDYQYQQVADALVFDTDNQAFLQENNPHALEEMTERLLEACQRGLWQEPGDTAAELQQLLLEIDQQQESQH
ncbi:cobaltochelatase subunit CobN [Maricurvus nonylphenolicus]|uniref:cobaltochelatase subunit CobN n=1 Tax=Maricurvus nonylphenolicus TaxID=1008307 RepID=UPI0036F1AF61